MSKRDVELKEYLRDMEIQLALTRFQHTNRASGRTKFSRGAKFSARRTPGWADQEYVRNPRKHNGNS